MGILIQMRYGEIVEDLLNLEKIQDQSQRRKGCSLITLMSTSCGRYM
jgi:hypothetical protein